jgi:hypothetical protein
VSELRTGVAAEGGHWYARNGSCVYEIRGANGKWRPVTLRDARKLKLCPGFSSIARMEAKPGLENWKIDQALMAALTLPRIEGETLEQFKARAKLDAEAQAIQARDRGTEIHRALEWYFTHGLLLEGHEDYVLPVVSLLADMFPDMDWNPEHSFCHPWGYGGKCDLLGDEVIIDFKCKDFDDPKTVRGYDEHEMQLHAYAHGFGIPGARMLNLFVSSTVPGAIAVVEWQWRPAALEAFYHLLKVWQIRKDYDSSWESA